MAALLECVPNFSEGQDLPVIHLLEAAIATVPGVHLLHVDRGVSANRTVFTFVGEPAAVVEAAFRAIKTASEHIDMRQQQGTHPRMGATDVCPLIPISGISEAEAIQYAHQLARRVGEELEIPVYLYEKSATVPERRNLATIRAGEYEGFREKIRLPAWKPDYGPQRFHPRAGQTVIGVRDFLIAYNLNLNTHSVPLANAVAFDIREIGRAKTQNGQKVRDAAGKVVRIPGACKAVKAIGWYIEEYGVAQVSTNITDINRSPVHTVFEAAGKAARKRGIEVTGSELIGLIPLRCLLEAGDFYHALSGDGRMLSESERVALAIRSLGLDELHPFDPQERVIEYQLPQA